MFNMGEIYETHKINDAIDNNKQFEKEILNCFMRYKNHDWGDICAKDKQSNDKALKNEEIRIFAAYETSKGKIYIITEWDRSATTIFFASEY